MSLWLKEVEVFPSKNLDVVMLIDGSEIIFKDKTILSNILFLKNDKEKPFKNSISEVILALKNLCSSKDKYIFFEYDSTEKDIVILDDTSIIGRLSYKKDGGYILLVLGESFGSEILKSFKKYVNDTLGENCFLAVEDDFDEVKKITEKEIKVPNKEVSEGELNIQLIKEDNK